MPQYLINVCGLWRLRCDWRAPGRKLFSILFSLKEKINPMWGRNKSRSSFSNCLPVRLNLPAPLAPSILFRHSSWVWLHPPRFTFEEGVTEWLVIMAGAGTAGSQSPVLVSIIPTYLSPSPGAQSSEQLSAARHSHLAWTRGKSFWIIERMRGDESKGEEHEYRKRGLMFP